MELTPQQRAALDAEHRRAVEQQRRDREELAAMQRRRAELDRLEDERNRSA